MKIAACFILVILINSISFSQYINTSYEDAREIKKRILLVGLQEEDKHFLLQYGEETIPNATIYKNDLEGQRQALKNAVLAHWKFNDSIIIVTLTEAKKLLKQFPQKYALLKIGQQIQDKVYVKGIHNPIAQVTGWQMQNGSLVYNSSNRYRLIMLGITTLVIEIPKRVIEVYLPKVSPSEGDFIYGLHQMDYILSSVMKVEGSSARKIYKDSKHLSAQLKTKILLLDRRELSCTEEEIKKIYPFSFRVVDYEMIEDALRIKDTSCVIIQSTRYDAANSSYYMSNAGDGKIYGYFTDATFKYGAVNGIQQNIQVFYPFINLDQIETLADFK